MSTLLCLRSTVLNAIGSFKDVATSNGSSTQTATTNTTASGNNIQMTATAGGSVVEWISGGSPIGGWTLSGQVTAKIWCRETNNNANAQPRMRLYKRAVGGTITELTGSPWDFGTEATTTMASKSWNFTPTSMAFAEDDRLIIRPYVAAFGTMGGSQTFIMNYDNTNGNSGDSSITLNETVAFKVDPVLRPQILL